MKFLTDLLGGLVTRKRLVHYGDVFIAAFVVDLGANQQHILGAHGLNALGSLAMGAAIVGGKAVIEVYRNSAPKVQAAAATMVAVLAGLFTVGVAHGAPAPKASTACHARAGGVLPDPACTPGALNPKVAQGNIRSTICVKGWTATIRPPASYTTALKKTQMKAYGLAGSTSAYEEDHLVSLELGGNPTDPRNLWPEPWNGTSGAHAKDKTENRLKAEICSGKLTLAAAQHAIATDWRTAP
jgi:hypothetical protein